MRVQCWFEDKPVWLPQKLMADLFGKDVRTINEHIQNVFTEGDLVPDSVIRKFRIIAADGKKLRDPALLPGRHPFGRLPRKKCLGHLPRAACNAGLSRRAGGMNKMRKNC